mmetsp:Transcript_36618/g.88750  ORF Transcript_36618/g.88750 Transcript_36618/m.88750 type:complete len:116 (+) Transcript_36618:212-559(+)
MGGKQPNPSYEELFDYAEALWIEFDPQEVSCQQLLQAWKKMHSPKTRSCRYRSVIWYLTEDQKAAATKTVDEWKVELHPVQLFTSVESASGLDFYRAEGYHQDYYLRTGQARFVS